MTASSRRPRQGIEPARRRTASAATALLSACALVPGFVGAPAAYAAMSAASTTEAAFTAGGDRLNTIFSGATLGISQPDDLTYIDGHLFVAFQNGIGPQGQPSPTGAKASTVVEMTTTGDVERTWQVTGHVDGLTADPATGLVIATDNEDAHSNLTTLDPVTGTEVRYNYDRSPLPHNGGTDAISFWHGAMLISASAPGTVGAKAPQAAYPAVYIVNLEASTHVAKVVPLFYDESSAVVANSGAGDGKVTKLGLTDPDSNEIVPATSPRFAGDFVLDSQGDKEQIYVSGSPAAAHLSVLHLSQSIDDTAWATAPRGALFIDDNADNIVDVLSGPFTPGTAFVAVTPCDADNAPAKCPSPGFPPNYLGTLDMSTGSISPLNLGGLQVQPQGLHFLPT